jgi:NTE family protein
MDQDVQDARTMLSRGGACEPRLAAAPVCRRPGELGQVTLVFQGGGALGAYQAGVYEALHAAGVEPDWVIGTSIGAINAALVVGNAREQRIERLREFWQRVQHGSAAQAMAQLPLVGPMASAWITMTHGVASFFTPNMRAFMGAGIPLGAESAGYYSTTPLAATLGELVDVGRINAGPTRLTVGAANVRTAAMHYFDSRDMALDLRHVMASGALPPAFPAVRIGGELYWDGGILSNTPVEAVFDDFPRRSGLVIAVHIWNPHGPEPQSIQEVMSRQKDIQYSSRATTHIVRQRELHRLRHVISELARLLPPEAAAREEARMLAAHGCLTRMHVVRLLAPSLAGEDHTKDIDFSPSGIAARWAAGKADAERMLAASPWDEPSDPLDGFVLHETPPSAAAVGRSGVA